MNRKGLAPLVIVIIVVIAIAIGGGALYFQQLAKRKGQNVQITPPAPISLPLPTPTPPPAAPTPASSTSPSTSLGTTGDIAGWQTYRNEKYGFEFKYPPTFKEQSYVAGDELTYCDGVEVESILNGCRGGKSYVIDEFVREYKLAPALLGQYFDTPPRLSDGTSGIKRYSINDRDFYIGKDKSTNKLYEGDESWRIYTALGDRTLNIVFKGDGFVLHNDSDALTDEELQNISKILSTFKFAN